MKTLSYEAFLSEIRMAVQKASPDDVSVSLQSIRKNNGVNLDALVISKDNGTPAPTIYVNPFYKDHKSGDLSIEEIANRIIWQYQNASIEEPFDLSDFTEFEKIKDKIIMKLVNRNLNSDQLTEVPHIDYLDLTITFSILLDVKDRHCATIQVRNELLNIWKKDVQDLYVCAKRNSPKLLPWKFNSMTDILGVLMCDLPDDSASEIPLYILNNNEGMYGASVILYEGVLQEVSEQIGGDFWVIPSSIHECLCIPTNGHVDAEALNEMIVSVNSSAVDAQEVLSDHCYIYNSKDGELAIPETATA